MLRNMTGEKIRFLAEDCPDFLEPREVHVHTIAELLVDPAITHVFTDCDSYVKIDSGDDDFPDNADDPVFIPVRTYVPRFSAILSLPAPQVGTLLVVTALSSSAFPERGDLVLPSGAVFCAVTGMTVGYRSLTRTRVQPPE